MSRLYMGFAIRSCASRRPYSYPYYHCSILDITFKMESSVKHLQLIFGRKRNNRSTCHLFSQDTDITSLSVSNRSTSTSKLGVWSLLKVPVRWFFAHHSMVWWLSLICHDCFVSLWFAVRLCVIQLYTRKGVQQQTALMFFFLWHIQYSFRQFKFILRILEISFLMTPKRLNLVPKAFLRRGEDGRRKALGTRLQKAGSWVSDSARAHA